MNQVATINSQVKPSVEDVYKWLEAKSERGELPATTARLKCTAIRQLVEPLDSDEPRDAEYVLSHIDDLTRRWATLNSKYKSDTAQTYSSRARSALEDYFRWQKDPVGFRFKDSAARVDKPKDREAARAKSVAQAAPAESTPLPSERPPGMNLRSLPIGKGREFTFVMPSEVSVSDVRRIAAHLLTFAEDWNPGTPFDPGVPPEAFGIVRDR